MGGHLVSGEKHRVIALTCFYYKLAQFNTVEKKRTSSNSLLTFSKIVNY